MKKIVKEKEIVIFFGFAFLLFFLLNYTFVRILMKWQEKEKKCLKKQTHSTNQDPIIGYQLG